MSVIYSSLIFVIATLSILMAGVMIYSSFDGKFDFKIDNPNSAVLISFAGFFVGISLMLINAFSGGSEISFLTELANVMVYIVSGFVMLLLSKFVFDKIVNRNYSVANELENGNKAVGIIDAANFVATGFVVFSTLYWYDLKTAQGLELTAIVYVLSMMMLTLYGVVYNKISKCSESFILSGNISEAVQRGVSRVSFSVSIGVSFSLMREFVNESSILLIFGWLSSSLVIYISIMLMSNMVSRITFNKEDKNYKIASAIVKIAIVMPAPFFFM